MNLLTTLLELAGVVAIVAGVAMFSVPAALVIGGAFAIVVGVLLA